MTTEQKRVTKQSFLRRVKTAQRVLEQGHIDAHQWLSDAKKRKSEFRLKHIRKEFFELEERAARLRVYIEVYL